MKGCMLSWVAGASKEGPVGPRRSEFVLFSSWSKSFLLVNNRKASKLYNHPFLAFLMRVSKYFTTGAESETFKNPLDKLTFFGSQEKKQPACITSSFSIWRWSGQHSRPTNIPKRFVSGCELIYRLRQVSPCLPIYLIRSGPFITTGTLYSIVSNKMQLIRLHNLLFRRI